jgi:hypothetical protein
MDSGQRCVIKEAVSLQIKLHSFYWKYTFFVFENSPVPCILGADTLSFTKMIKRADPSVRNFKLENDTIIQFSPGTKTKRYLVPMALQAMILAYLHDSTLSAHLGVVKTLCRISKFLLAGHQGRCSYMCQAVSRMPEGKASAKYPGGAIES